MQTDRFLNYAVMVFYTCILGFAGQAVAQPEWLSPELRALFPGLSDMEWSALAIDAQNNYRYVNAGDNLFDSALLSFDAQTKFNAGISGILGDLPGLGNDRVFRIADRVQTRLRSGRLQIGFLPMGSSVAEFVSGSVMEGKLTDLILLNPSAMLEPPATMGYAFPIGTSSANYLGASIVHEGSHLEYYLLAKAKLKGMGVSQSMIYNILSRNLHGTYREEVAAQMAGFEALGMPTDMAYLQAQIQAMSPGYRQYRGQSVKLRLGQHLENVVEDMGGTGRSHPNPQQWLGSDRAFVETAPGFGGPRLIGRLKTAARIGLGGAMVGGAYWQARQRAATISGIANGTAAAALAVDVNARRNALIERLASDTSMDLGIDINEPLGNRRGEALRIFSEGIFDAVEAGPTLLDVLPFP